MRIKNDNSLEGLKPVEETRPQVPKEAPNYRAKESKHDYRLPNVGNMPIGREEALKDKKYERERETIDEEVNLTILDII